MVYDCCNGQEEYVHHSSLLEMISTIVLLIFVFSVAVSAEYNKVVGEKCNNLQTPSALFDYLLPCGVYK